MKPTRDERIRFYLDSFIFGGVIRGYYTHSPGDRHGRRWTIELSNGHATTLLGTRECECWVKGALAIWEHEHPTARL